jgi:riboflavin synthase
LGNMFTGIVEKISKVAAVIDSGSFRRLELKLDFDVQIGQSIAVNGCCLTVAEVSAPGVSAGGTFFDVIKETLDKTNLGMLEAGDEVNIERCLEVGDRVDGHFVQGHIDGTALLMEVIGSAQEYVLRMETTAELAKYIALKGSVALDGVSLTVAKVNGQMFEVALIPTTLQNTTLGKKGRGWDFNLETDILSKTVVSWLERQK